MNQVLCIGIDPDCMTLIASKIPEAQIVTREPNLDRLSEEVLSPPPSIIFCGNPPEGIKPIEFGQFLSMQYQGCPLYYFSSSKTHYDRKLLVKNGFTDGFLYPLDQFTVTDLLDEEISRWSSGARKVFKPVKLIDIEPGATLDFDTFIYMPVNKKHIKFSGAGDALDADRVERLRKKQVASVHVSSDQMKKFYEFSARQLRKLGDSKAMSETEKRERIQGAVRELVSGIFNDSTGSIAEGKSLVNDCQEIVKSYILDSPSVKEGGKSSWYEKILSLSDANSSAYSHASSVATFASLFSIGMGIGSPEEIGVAAILHDIGLSDVPMEIQLKPDSERAPHEKIQYNKHVDASIEIIKTRKLVVSDLVMKIIVQHHERYNGTGYPKGLTGDRICKEAQILALADEFTDLMTLADGKPRMSPLEALRTIQKENASGLNAQKYDPELLKKLAALFPESNP